MVAFEVGRVCTKVRGREAGEKCVVVDVVDENYVRESIIDPSAKIHAGYDDKMNSFQGQLSDEELGFLIKFIQSLK